MFVTTIDLTVYIATCTSMSMQYYINKYTYISVHTLSDAARNTVLQHQLPVKKNPTLQKHLANQRLVHDLVSTSVAHASSYSLPLSLDQIPP